MKFELKMLERLKFIVVKASKQPGPVIIFHYGDSKKRFCSCAPS